MEMLSDDSGTDAPNLCKDKSIAKVVCEVDCCAECISMLHGMIRDARTKSRIIYVVTLDLAKAFNAVNHELVFQALRWYGAGNHFTEVVCDLYDHSVVWKCGHW